MFQAYCTTFLLELGYEELIKNREQMLKSEMKFGFPGQYIIMFTDESDTVESAIRKDGVECHNEPMFRVGNCILQHFNYFKRFNPLNPELNPICYLLALLGARHFLHVSRIRVKLLTLRRLMSYIYIYIYIYIWSTHS